MLLRRAARLLPRLLPLRPSAATVACSAQRVGWSARPISLSAQSCGRSVAAHARSASAAPPAPPPPENRVTDVELASEASSSFLSYAMSVIVGRALPDVRDGLKPVHRCAPTHSRCSPAYRLNARERATGGLAQPPAALLTLPSRHPPPAESSTPCTTWVYARPSLSASARAWWARCWVSTTHTATKRCTTRSCAWYASPALPGCTRGTDRRSVGSGLCDGRAAGCGPRQLRFAGRGPARRDALHRVQAAASVGRHVAGGSERVHGGVHVHVRWQPERAGCAAGAAAQPAA